MTLQPPNTLLPNLLILSSISSREIYEYEVFLFQLFRMNLLESFQQKNSCIFTLFSINFVYDNQNSKREENFRERTRKLRIVKLLKKNFEQKSLFLISKITFILRFIIRFLHKLKLRHLRKLSNSTKAWFIILYN